MTWLLVLVVLGLILASGFFSGAETAITSANRVSIRNQADAGDLRARITIKLLTRLESIIATTLVGNNLVNVAGTALAESLVHQHFSGEYESIVNTLIMTPVILVLGEMVPKSIGRSHANQLALLVSKPLLVLEWLFAPVVWLTDHTAALMARLIKGKTTHRPDQVTREDLRAMAELAAEQGLLPKSAGTMLRTVFELDTLPLSSVMVPLVNVRSVSVSATVRDVEILAAETGFTRFPVYESRVDEVIGVVDLRPILYASCAPGPGPALSPDSPIAPFVQRTIAFVPETKSVGDLIHELRYQHLPMAAVVDEHGGVVGIVTTEDMIEEVVGDIGDERDLPAGRKAMRVTPEGFECDGKVEVRRVENELKIVIERDGFETVAGLVLKLAGCIPKVGDRFKFKNYEIEILTMERRSIARVRFHLRHPVDD